MKVNRTFSIDLWIVEELKAKRNQSQFVCDAIKYKLDDTYMDISDASVSSLMIWLKNHPECDSFIKETLETSLRAAYKHSVRNQESNSTQ